ncbi:MAG: leucine-rich repeat domain-containing protein [Oscillospiraceae bacterium]|nr:leucine-rich repeat domain-containing protein [Oscillospiraceae bacterium]
MGILDRLTGLLHTRFAAEMKASREILESQYAGREDLTEFAVPANITVIGHRAFENCKNLVSVSLPAGLERIASNAFSGCTSLREIHIPEGIREIGNGAFADCVSLECIRLPESLSGTEISGGLFSGCTSLKSITFPKKLSGSFANVFPQCSALKEITLPDGIMEIGSFTFQRCTGLETVRIPDALEKICNKAFMKCSNLRDIFIPDSVKHIDAFQTFAGCTALRSIRLPAGITFHLQPPAEESTDAVLLCFQECNALKTVTLGTRSFSVGSERFDDNHLLMMQSALAADGDPAALAAVSQRPDAVLWALTVLHEADLAARILPLLPVELLTEPIMVNAADSAGMIGDQRIFALIVKYMRSRGMDTAAFNEYIEE